VFALEDVDLPQFEIEVAFLQNPLHQCRSGEVAAIENKHPLRSAGEETVSARLRARVVRPGGGVNA
jgi:hypothetical protein